jgi:hypothetical protein
MKRIAAISLILAAGFLTAGSALAQTNKTVANIPFAFNLNGRTLPAGHYTLSTEVNAPNVLMVEDRDDAVHILTIALPGSEESSKDNTLVFHKYGNQYFLTTIRANGASMNCHLATSKQEKWAKAQTQDASLRVNDNILIPLQ